MENGKNGKTVRPKKFKWKMSQFTDIFRNVKVASQKLQKRLSRNASVKSVPGGLLEKRWKSADDFKKIISTPVVIDEDSPSFGQASEKLHARCWDRLSTPTASMSRAQRRAISFRFIRRKRESKTDNKIVYISEEIIT